MIRFFIGFFVLFSAGYAPIADFLCERIRLGSVKKMPQAKYLLRALTFDTSLPVKVEGNYFLAALDLPWRTTSNI